MNRIPYYASLLTSGGGSFSIFPWILRDQTLTLNGLGPNDGGFRFIQGDSSLWQNGGGSLITVDTTPLQFHDNRPGGSPAEFQVRHIALFDSNVTAFVFDFPALNMWRTITGVRAFDMVRPPASTTEGFTCTIQIAPTADLTDIQAQADIRYEWTRP